MFTTSIPSNPTAAVGILADPDERPVPRHVDGGDLMHEVVQVKARQHALRLAEEVVRSVVSPSDAARSSAAWRDVHRTVQRLQRAATDLAASPLFDARNAAALPQELVLNLRDVAPAQLVATLCAPCTALMDGVVQAARRGDVADFQNATHKLLFLGGRIRALGALVDQLDTLAAQPAHFVKPGWFGRQPAGTWAPPLRDDIRQLLASLKPVQGALANPRGAVQLLLAFARAAQDFPAEVADITRRHATAKALSSHQ